MSKREIAERYNAPEDKIRPQLLSLPPRHKSSLGFFCEGGLGGRRGGDIGKLLWENIRP